MAEESAKLRIPYIAASQAQKHVTHNEAMTLLDTLVQLSVKDKDLTAPPGSPAEGDCYIVAGGGGTATGAWAGWEKRIARFIDGAWRSYLPGAGDGAGWLAWVMDEDAMYRFDGTAWALAGIEGPQGPAGADGPPGPTGPTGPAGASALTICRAKTTANVNLAGGGLANGTSHDGVTLNTGDRVLVTAQTAAAENGVYIVPASGAASRDTAFDTYDEHPGVYFSVMEGSANADTLWRCTSNRGGVLGTTSIVFTQFQGGGGVARQIFTSPGTYTYTPTSGMKYAIIECIGGGGSGGGAAGSPSGQGAASGGGGSGQYARKLVTAADIGASKPVTVGAGGAAVTGNANGNAGGATSVGTLCIADGGRGGTGASSGSTPGCESGGSGGFSGGVGDVVVNGQAGSPGMRFGGSGSQSIGGNGAPGPFGGGGQGSRANSSTANGQDGSKGGGGSGAATHNNGSVNATSGAGGDGLVIITEFL